jgi:hypothetical protein
MMSDPSRRGALQFSLTALAAGFTMPAIASAETNSDAALIQLCRRFAEQELEGWYAYITEVEDSELPDVEDWATTGAKIIATPATTFEGMRAKALAYSAFDTSAYTDDCEDTAELALTRSLLNDMVGRERGAIVRRLAAKYGPLPPEYTAEGVFIGFGPEAEAERQARQVAHEAEMERKRDINRMTQAELKEAATVFRLQRLHAEASMALIAQRLPGDVA